MGRQRLQPVQFEPVPRPFAQRRRDSRIETLLYVFDQNGTAVYGSGETVDPNAGTGPITIAQTVKLPPGRYVAKAIARIAGTASLGFARTEFTVQ